MSTQIKLWKIENDKPVEVESSKLELEGNLEEWLTNDIRLISENLLVIGNQVETDYGGFIDILAIDVEGNLVILELKRDKTPRDIVAQTLDYASWVVTLRSEKII